MKHKSIHISRIIICILVAFGAFLSGMIYGEKAEKKRIAAGFVKVFQEQFGTPGTGANVSGSNLTGVVK
ncbi:hypothetical protein KBC03_05360 [Patescibacteria group bacterium]|nr:hypothetical protein [Patescibacteria group bacterium]